MNIEIEEKILERQAEATYHLGKLHGIELVCNRFKINYKDALNALGIKS